MTHKGAIIPTYVYTNVCIYIPCYECTSVYMCFCFCRMYKPLVREMKTWPVLNLNCSAGSSPFDSPLLQKLHKRRVRKTLVAPSCAIPRLNMDSIERKPGYCECCKTHFADMKMASCVYWHSVGWVYLCMFLHECLFL